MKLQPDRSHAPVVVSYGADWVVLQGVRDANTNEPSGPVRLQQSFILCSQGPQTAWPCHHFAELNAQHFAPLAALPVEIVIFGSGNVQRFVPPAWLAPLMHKRIGMETMNLPAACRTYNILASEGRKVALALLIEPIHTASPQAAGSPGISS